MKKLLTAAQIAHVQDQMVEQILPDVPKDKNFAVIGIRNRGEILAQRLSAALSKKAGWEVPCGTLDISLYRDDLNTPKAAAQVRVQPTEIPFSIDGKYILLVDDVLHTGRSVRAAMDALTDLGRPKKMLLAVLVDRGNQELPIRADYVGIRTDVPLEQVVRVHLKESDGKEEVVVEKSS
jgi:pyrimidine operon attenuation protein/uracil phosphoribosyltransferase